MEYKICENCDAKIHVRTAKCPICNAVLTDASKIVNDNNITTENIGENIDVQFSDTETINHLEGNIDAAPQKTEDVKDYVYKAEVRHSLEYTKPLSNGLKVFLTALSMMPLMGQFIGTFMGIFYATYDDNDRRSFGKALIFLSIIMFIFYTYSFMLSSEILNSGEFSNYLNNFVK